MVDKGIDRGVGDNDIRDHRAYNCGLIKNSTVVLALIMLWIQYTRHQIVIKGQKMFQLTLKYCATHSSKSEPL